MSPAQLDSFIVAANAGQVSGVINVSVWCDGSSPCMVFDGQDSGDPHGHWRGGYNVKVEDLVVQLVELRAEVERRDALIRSDGYVDMMALATSHLARAERAEAALKLAKEALDDAEETITQADVDVCGFPSRPGSTVQSAMGACHELCLKPGLERVRAALAVLGKTQTDPQSVKASRPKCPNHVDGHVVAAVTPGTDRKRWVCLKCSKNLGDAGPRDDGFEKP